jgi:4a-hydroxytetrahydrobiopterin dehydratase
MSKQPFEALSKAKCTPCEGGVTAFSEAEAKDQLAELNGWELDKTASSISKSWNMKTFSKALKFANQIGELAEEEQHHPDLHLTGYRHLSVVLTTHAIGGLSINDFILAAKIDKLS